MKMRVPQEWYFIWSSSFISQVRMSETEHDMSNDDRMQRWTTQGPHTIEEEVMA